MKDLVATFVACQVNLGLKNSTITRVLGAMNGIDKTQKTSMGSFSAVAKFPVRQSLPLFVVRDSQSPWTISREHLFQELFVQQLASLSMAASS